MKKIVSISMVLCLFLLLFAGCASGGEVKSGGTLNLYTWAEMFDPDVLADFEKETGITINYTNFDYDETMLARLEAAEGGEYDLIIADDYIIETVIAEGLAQKLDKSKLANYGNINPIYQGQFYDPTDEYTVPYGAGVQTIVYNPEKISVDVKGYSDLWDPAFEDNLAVIANYRVIVGMAEKVLGYSYNNNDLAQIEEAGELLYELAPNIRLIKDDNVQDDLVSGEVDAAVMYTSQVTMAKLANPDLKVVYPEEGIGFGIMGMFIPSKAPNADAALAFIDYILRPEVSKASFEYLGYYCTTKAADDLISDEFREFLVLPDTFKAEDMEMIGNISAEASEKQDAIWTRFKDLCE
ncbi:MAG: spermidine/putrescine ABC transporter substrate-binding protein [Oscillospiraceae bacterium]|nr:spermidine/putrescine ABC transporter substrate-binding protein [Oscillospiraceae bacterium]